jgi:IclR family transcriptional regulator, KDG regulon repressor
MKNNRPYLVPAIDRAARIMSLLQTEGELTLVEISEAIGLHKSSVHKIVVTLNYHGLLDRDAVTRKYSLGVALSEYGRTALSSLDVRRLAKPYLKTMVDYTGETAALAVLRDTKIVLVDVEEPQVQIRVSLRVGMSSPATTTSNGKAVLAWLPENRISEIMESEGLPAKTKNSIAKPGIFRNELKAVRARGYATDYEEYQKGISGISAPILNSKGTPIGALSLAIPTFRLAKGNVPKYGRKCAEMAAKLSEMLR